MKTYNPLLSISLTIVIFITMSANMGHGDELLGKVVKTIAKQVEIKLEGELIPQIGDEVIIGFDMEPIGFVPLQGKWRVSAINPTTLTADPNGDTRQPQKDQLVKIISPSPLSRKSMQKEAENLDEKAEDYFHGRNGVNKDYAKALELYHQAVEKGSHDAMASIGYMYGTGTWVAKNYTKALEWFRKAAEQRNAIAQRNLGIMYENGRGVTKDNKVACEWYLKAAKQGRANAQKNLGVMYEHGRGIARDNQAAFEWYLRAAKQGHVDAQCNLGAMYFRGKGTVRDYQKATQWYLRAAKQGDATAQYSLGIIYDQGRGVPENDAEAIIWYRKAADQGYADAKKALTRLGQ